MKKIIRSLNAPKPIGPYNQAILVNDTLYLSGQIGLDPHSMKLVKGGIKNETKQVMENLKSVLEAAEMNLDQVVKSSIFLSDMLILKRSMKFMEVIKVKLHQLEKQ